MFSIKESIKFSWQKVKTNFWKVVGLMIIATVPSYIVSMLSSVMKDADSVSSKLFLFLLIVAVNIVSVMIGIGLMKMFFRIHDGENPPIKEIFSAYGVFWKYIGTSILYGFIVLGGFILLIVPGIIWAIKYSFATLIVVDTKSGPIAALKESGNITKGSKWKLLGFGIVSGLIAMLGYLALFVGALVTVPIAILAWTHVYRTLSRAKAAVSNNPLPSPQTA